MNDSVFYIAYGSNLNIVQMDRRCPGAQVAFTGRLNGYQLVFRMSQSGHYLSVDPCEGSSVQVAVWQISFDHELTLDICEGYPRHYQKAVLPVECDASQGSVEIEGILYYLPEEREEGPCSREYLERVLAGYRHFGFDERPLLDAYDRACAAEPAR